MPPSPECKPFADAIATLNSQEKAKRDEITKLAGAAKWRAMEELGTIRTQISEQQALLDDCEKAHAADLNMDVAVFDVGGNSNNGNRIARLWQLTSTGPAVKQTAMVLAGVATFQNFTGNARQGFGLTIEEVQHPTVSGPDFRFGPLPLAPPAPIADPLTRAEIVILDPVIISQDSLAEAIPPLPIPLSISAGAVGAINISVAQVQFVVENSTLRVAASGTLSAIGSTTPFTFSSDLHVSPSFGMTPNEILDVATANPPTLTMPGMVGSIVKDLTGFVSSNLLSATIQPLVALLNKLIVAQVAASLGLDVLPSGVVLSVRQLSPGAGNISLEPSLAAFGTTLSDFQPSAPQPAAQLALLELSPASISSSEPASRTSQGKVTLTGPAPSGGVTVMLSIDHPELAVVNPTQLAIAEAGTTSTFSVTGAGQFLSPADHVDCTVTASFGTQNMTAPISVKREPPATPVSTQTLMPTSSLVPPDAVMLESHIFAIMNGMRTSAGGTPWTLDTVAADAARGHSIDMASGKVPFGTDGFSERSMQIGAQTGHPATLEIPVMGFQTAPDFARGVMNDKDSTGVPFVSQPAAGQRLGLGIARSQGGTYFLTAIFS